MPADAEGALGGEALLAGFAAPDIMQEASVAVENGVGDDLFETRIVLREIAGEEGILFWIKDGGKIPVHVRGEALKGSEGIEEGPGND
jgi:hypothetical protein